MTNPLASQKLQIYHEDHERQEYLQRLVEEFKTILKELFESDLKEVKTKTKNMRSTIFTNVYNILYVVEKLRQLDTKTVDELYLETHKYLTDFLSKKILSGQELKGEELLQFYSNLWNSYQVRSTILNKGATNLNGFYNKKIKEGMTIDKLEIYSLALSIWKEVVFHKLQEEVTDTVLDLMERDRRGETIDPSGISGALESYVELGLVDPNYTKYTLADAIARGNEEEPHLTIYQKYFENVFCIITELFYAKEAMDFLKENTDFDECTKKMETHLEEEQKRVEVHLHQSTGERINQNFQAVFKMISDSCLGWNMETLHKHEKF